MQPLTVKAKVSFASGSKAYIQEKQLIILADTWNALEQSLTYSSKAFQSRQRPRQKVKYGQQKLPRGEHWHRINMKFVQNDT